MYQLNPLLTEGLLTGIFGFGKPKYSEDALNLAKVMGYIATNIDTDPDLIKAEAQLKKLGMSIYGSKYEYTNLILCWYTVYDQMKRYRISPNDIVQSSRSAKRLLEWGRSKGIIS